MKWKIEEVVKRALALFVMPPRTEVAPAFAHCFHVMYVSFSNGRTNSPSRLRVQISSQVEGISNLFAPSTPPPCLACPALYNSFPSPPASTHETISKCLPRPPSIYLFFKMLGQAIAQVAKIQQADKRFSAAEQTEALNPTEASLFLRRT